jgi:hypothetical protein
MLPVITKKTTYNQADYRVSRACLEKGFNTPAIRYLNIVIPAKAGAQVDTGCRSKIPHSSEIKSGMTRLVYLVARLTHWKRKGLIGLAQSWYTASKNRSGLLNRHVPEIALNQIRIMRSESPTTPVGQSFRNLVGCELFLINLGT